MKRLLVLVLCGSLSGSGCASMSASPAPFAPSQRVVRDRVNPVVMADYVRQLPVGSKVRLNLANGERVHGILMKRDGDPIVVQRRTRLPETPMEISIEDILALEIENGGSNPARTVAIGAAVAVGATLGVLMLLAAIFSD